MTTSSYFSKPSHQQVKVRDDLSKLVPAKDSVDNLHLLSVGEEVPVVESEVSCDLAGRVLREWKYWLLVLVL